MRMPPPRMELTNGCDSPSEQICVGIEVFSHQLQRWRVCFYRLCGDRHNCEEQDRLVVPGSPQPCHFNLHL